MKTVIVMAALVLAVNTASAQKIKEAEVPPAVLKSFNENFKGAKVEKWEKEKDGEYEANFALNKQESSANFAADGKLLETETEIKISELPKGISDYITKDYGGFKMEEASKLTDAAGKILFEVEVEKGKEEFDLIFDSNGAFVRKDVKEKGEKDEKDEKKAK